MPWISLALLAGIIAVALAKWDERSRRRKRRPITFTFAHWRAVKGHEPARESTHRTETSDPSERS